MAQITLRNKMITIENELYRQLRERLFEFDDVDCRFFLEAALTTGDIDSGFSCPDIDEVIETYSEEELSRLISRGAKLQREAIV